jgi:hypothetical protein
MLEVVVEVDIMLPLAVVVADLAGKGNLIMLVNCQHLGWPTLAGAGAVELLLEFLQVQWPAGAVAA